LGLHNGGLAPGDRYLDDFLVTAVAIQGKGMYRTLDPEPFDNVPLCIRATVVSAAVAAAGAGDAK